MANRWKNVFELFYWGLSPPCRGEVGQWCPQLHLGLIGMQGDLPQWDEAKL